MSRPARRRCILTLSKTKANLPEGATSSSPLRHGNFRGNVFHTFVFGEYKTAVPRSYAPIQQKACPYALRVRERTACSTKTPLPLLKKGGGSLAKEKASSMPQSKAAKFRVYYKKARKSLEILELQLSDLKDDLLGLAHDPHTGDPHLCLTGDPHGTHIGETPLSTKKKSRK